MYPEALDTELFLFDYTSLPEPVFIVLNQFKNSHLGTATSALPLPSGVNWIFLSCDPKIREMGGEVLYRPTVLLST